jgi:hypothetical protein
MLRVQLRVGRHFRKGVSNRDVENAGSSRICIVTIVDYQLPFPPLPVFHFRQGLSERPARQVKT